MQTYVARRGLTTLGELCRQSETHLLSGERVGRITVRRTFLAVVAFARCEGTPVVMLPAVALKAAGDRAHAPLVKPTRAPSAR